jgi:hypothetical protein
MATVPTACYLLFGLDLNKRTGGWRRLHNDDLHHILFRVTKLRNVRYRGHVTSMGEMRNRYEILGGKPEEKRPLGSSVSR